MEDLQLDETPWKATVILVGVVVLVVGIFLTVGRGGPDPTPAGAPAGPSGPSVSTAPGGVVVPPSTTLPVPTKPGQPTASPTGPVAPGDTPVCVTEQDRGRLRVLSFNIKAGQLSGGLEPIASLVEATKADVVLLQEVDQSTARTGRVDQPSILGARLGMAWGFGRNIRFGGGSYGTVILSRFPMLDVTNLALPNIRGQEQRGLLHAKVVVGGVTVSLYNTHLEAGRVSGLRQRQVDRIAAVLRADDNPVIMGGDFNASPGSTEIGRVRGVLVDTWAEVGVGSGNTVPAGAPRNRIDYLFHSPEGVRAVSSTVLGARLSDHLGILSDYVVRGDATKTCVDLPLPAPQG